MWSYNYTPISDFLCHHGIVGMKWGVRRFQNADGTLTAQGKARYSVNRTTAKTGAFEAIAATVKASAAVTACYNAITYAYDKMQYKINRNKFNKELTIDRYENRQIKTLEECPKMKKNTNPMDSLLRVNPDYPQPGATHNCMLCTLAMAMRQKGYKVQASHADRGFYEDDFFRTTFNTPHHRFNKAKNKNDILSEIAKHGDGSYGSIGFNWKLGGGHSLFWKNENGKINIYDGQVGRVYSDDNMDELFNRVALNSTGYTRLDDRDPTEYVLGVVEKEDRPREIFRR